MAYLRILIWGFSVISRTVIAIQTAVTQNADLAFDGIETSPFRIFVSQNNLWCGQAQVDVAKDALSLYKSMPRGKLYEDVRLIGWNTSCADLGYTFSQVEDPCYPGLQSSFRNEEEMKQFLDSIQSTLTVFGRQFNFDLNDTRLLDACKCKNDSMAIKYWGTSCERVNTLFTLATRSGVKPTNTQPSEMHSFVSINKKFCAQARPRVVEGALALFKAMPRGKLYVDTLIHSNDTQSCEKLGYKYSAGEDPCYPGLQTFYRNGEEKQDFMDDLHSTLNDFAVLYNVTLDDALLMDSCTCHVDSSALKYRGQSCAALDSREASWVHREPLTDQKLMCAGGPFVLATRSLAVLKLAEEMPMHKNDQIAPRQCEEFGFPIRFPIADACFTGIHAWTETSDTVHDTLKLETQRVLDELMSGGFKNYTESLRLDRAGFGRDARCKCAPNSELYKQTQGLCEELGKRPSIREWWKE